jgi:hypothetical protein
MKVVRAARKLPEKCAYFYRELNRVRKLAVGYGFDTLLPSLAAALDREALTLPQGAHPEAALQLTHAAARLRDDPWNPVQAMVTKFQGGR